MSSPCVTSFGEGLTATLSPCLRLSTHCKKTFFCVCLRQRVNKQLQIQMAYVYFQALGRPVQVD